MFAVCTVRYVPDADDEMNYVRLIDDQTLEIVDSFDMVRRRLSSLLFLSFVLLSSSLFLSFVLCVENCRVCAASTLFVCLTP